MADRDHEHRLPSRHRRRGRAARSTDATWCSPTQGNVWENYPGAAHRRRSEEGRLHQAGLAAQQLPALSGNVAHVYTDANDNNAAEQVRRSRRAAPGSSATRSSTFTPDCLRARSSSAPGTPRSRTPGRPTGSRTPSSCSPSSAGSTTTSPRSRSASPAPPATSRRSTVTRSRATPSTAPPRGRRTATTSTTPTWPRRPTASPPRMQMYLFHQPGTAFPDEDPFIAGNSGDEADIVYHEYTHGLSNRLVVDALGNSTLGNIQAGSMGEAWTDWYAMDFLVNEGLFKDTPADGELRVGQYVGWGNDLIRTQPVDCPVGSTSAELPRHPRRRAGWLHLRRLRRRSSAVPRCTRTARSGCRPCGTCATSSAQDLSESLVTRAMELSPANPSFLDMRNSILAGRHGRSATARTRTRSGPSSPPAAWASSPAASTATTPHRRRTSRCRRPADTPARHADRHRPRPGHREPGRGRDRRVRWPRLRVSAATTRPSPTPRAVHDHRDHPRDLPEGVRSLVPATTRWCRPCRSPRGPRRSTGACAGTGRPPAVAAP